MTTLCADYGLPAARDSAIPEPIKKSEFAGAGCLLQGVGLLCPLIGFWFGTVVAGGAGGVLGAGIGALPALVLLIVGSRRAHTWRCSDCMNTLVDRDVRICPVCRVTFDD